MRNVTGKVLDLTHHAYHPTSEQSVSKRKTILDFFPKLVRDVRDQNLIPEVIGEFVIHKRKPSPSVQVDFDNEANYVAGQVAPEVTQSVGDPEPVVMSPTRNKRVRNSDKFTPLKRHSATVKVEAKVNGIHSGCVVSSPSKATYMFKTFGLSRERCNRDIIHELAAGNLVRLYMGKSRAPVIGVCSSLFNNVAAFGLSSAMFTSFVQLKDTEWQLTKPAGFEEMLVVCGIVGDSDIHQMNVGFNQDGEFCKLDHGRAFMLKYSSGLEFLHVLTSVCETTGYKYVLSLRALREKLQFINSQGLDVPKRMISDAFMAISSMASEMPNMFPMEVGPYKLGQYKHVPNGSEPLEKMEDSYDSKYNYVANEKNWACTSSTQPSSFVQQCKPTSFASVRIESWEQYNGYIASTLTANMGIVNEAVEIIESMERNRYIDVKIQSKGRSYALHENGRAGSFAFQRMM